MLFCGSLLFEETIEMVNMYELIEGKKCNNIILFIIFLFFLFLSVLILF